MKNHLQRSLLIAILYAFCCWTMLLPIKAFALDLKIYERISYLENDYKELSHTFYQHFNTGQTITDIDQLKLSVARLLDSKKTISAIQLLYANIETINDNIDNAAVFDFIELLLVNNEWQLASRLYEEIQYEGDKSLSATVNFLFAKYHSQRHEWQQVHDLLSGQFSELSNDNAAYAYLLNGSALQHLKQHREAANSYSKVPQNSRFYYHAQLNTAITNIRQGWWTDAQTVINRLLKSSNKDNSDELVNRLNLVLGYSLLQREYYRDARNAFRRIGLNSRYTNRALLGIGLTATSQGDYIGGMNALTILKDKKTPDLSVDESYLLVPYVYEKLQQELTVSASYTEAMNYYQNRITELELIANKPLSINDISFDNETSSITLNNNSLDYARYYPTSFIHNFYRLNELLDQAKDNKLKLNIESLIKQHNTALNHILKDLLNRRIDFLKSYLNQARYGLARLYDDSQQTNQGSIE